MAPTFDLPSARAPSRRGIAAVVSVGVHAAILFALISRPKVVPPVVEPKAMTVSLISEPRPRPDAPRGALATATVKPPARSTPARPATAASTAATTYASTSPGDVTSGAALGSATSADALPGGDCDMARRLQAALRRDALVRAAVVARGLSGEDSAILVWNGGWVASPGEDGKGLAAVREAIVWEVAFAPAVCRAERVHGPVLFRISDTRIAVGAGDWRWGDLVSSR